MNLIIPNKNVGKKVAIFLFFSNRSKSTLVFTFSSKISLSPEPNPLKNTNMFGKKSNKKCVFVFSRDYLCFSIVSGLFLRGKKVLTDVSFKTTRALFFLQPGRLDWVFCGAIMRCNQRQGAELSVSRIEIAYRGAAMIGPVPPRLQSRPCAQSALHWLIVNASRYGQFGPTPFPSR